MATELAYLGYKVDSSGFLVADKRMKQTMDTSKKTEREIKSLDESFLSLKGAVGVTAAALASFGAGTKLTSIAREFDVFMAQLKTATGSITAAREEFQRLSEFAASTPFDLSQSIEGFIKLKNLGLDPSIESLTSFGNTASAMGKSLSDMIEAVADASTNEFERLKEFGIKAKQETDKVIFTFQGVETSIAKNAEAIQGYLKSIGDVQFGGAMEDRVNSLDGALSNLTDTWDGLFRAISQNGAGSAIESGAREATDAIQYLTDNINALENSVLTLFAGASAYAAFMGGKYVTSALAGVAAHQKQIASNAILDASYKKSVATKLAGDEAKIASEVRMISMQKASLIEQIKLSSIEHRREGLRTVLTGVTARLAAAENALAAATARTTAATATATAASGAASAALTAQTTRAMLATGAMNALGVATRFALGPWGLLIGVLGSAALAFNLTTEASDKQNKSLEEQLDLTKKTAEQVRILSEYQRANVAIQAQFELNDLKAQQLKIEQDLLTQSFAQNQPVGLTLKSNEKLAAIKSRILELEGLISAAQGGSKGSGVADETNKQLKALEQMRLEVGMTSDELFVFREQQKSIANNDAPAVTQAITAQAMAIVSAKNAITDAESAFARMNTSVSDAVSEYDQWTDSVWKSANAAKVLEQEIKRVEFALSMGDLDQDTATKYIRSLRDQISEINMNPFKSMTDGAKDALSAMSGMFESGSRDAKKLAIAMQALNLVQAVGAVLNQGKGDPYTAFGRMASMAAMVASLGMSIGGLSGGFEDKSKAAQESQGLDTWGNKSQSIANATDITANATKKLVGINTSMLKALENLGAALGAASGLIVRDTKFPQVNVSGDMIDFNKFRIDPFEDILPTFMTDFIGSAIAGLLGGESKVVNEGIRIVGGQLTDLMDEVVVQAFQTVDYKKWKFGKTKSKTQYENLGEDVSNQVSLVLTSLADAVSAGATMLGISSTDIEKRINEFDLATIDISLKGLSAEDKQKEIESVFSKIFDDITAEVVPFADEFQKVGESLGETLGRLATQASIADVMTERFGVTFGDKFADPEAFTKAADNIATLVGGVENMANLTASFTDAFATDQQKFAIYQSSMIEQLSAIGLTLPDTTSGFYDLMQGLDATTEEGQKQIAVLLGLTDTASEYYKLLESTAGRYRDAAKALYGVDEAAKQISLNAALNAARIGDFSLAEQLNLSGLTPDASRYSSAFELELARAETAAKLNELADLQAGQVTVDEKQLSELEKINAALREQSSPDSKSNTELIEATKELSKKQQQTNELLHKLWRNSDTQSGALLAIAENGVS